MRPGQRGQALVFVATMLGTLVLFAGLTIDVGSAYVTRARLSRAADAASLVAMRNLALGKDVAKQAAEDAFNANFPDTGGKAPKIKVNFGQDANKNTTVSVTASAKMKTSFIRVVPQLKTLDVGVSAEAVRALLMMSLVLDRSGSMVSNGGWANLAPAVDDFIDRFDDNRDRVAMVTFAGTVRTDVTMRTVFKDEIKKKVPRLVSAFTGYTNSPGGLQAAYDEIKNAKIVGKEKPTKIVVFFTDGLANTFPYSEKCTGFDAFVLAATSDPWYALMNPTVENVSYCSAKTAPSLCCDKLGTFKSFDGTNKTTSAKNILAEAKGWSIKIASDMRKEDMIVFSIGLGGTAVDQAFLRQIANDPSATTFDPSQPVGEAFFPNTASELEVIFQTIAAKILMRLTK
jgi:Mg-chelatase subunit ChlD